MEYVEAPSIQYPARNVVFPFIKWLNKDRFVELINKQEQIHPYIDSIYANATDDHNAARSKPTERIYVGKSIQSNLQEGVKHYEYGYSGDQTSMALEIIGSVSRNLNGDWELTVSHASTSHVIKNKFLVLYIEDPESYHWVRTTRQNIPRFALRGCIDRLTREYFYIGKTPIDDHQTRPSIFQNGRVWVPFEETVPNLFGKVHVSHQCLYVGFNKLELTFNTYDILCLKPSPSSLKILARSYLRSWFKHSNENMDKINEGQKRLPDNLLQFVKYPNCLRVGEYMMKGEKIVRPDDKFEMLIERNNALFIRSIVRTKDQDNLSPAELFDLECKQLRSLIFTNIDSIWCHPFQIALYQTNGRVHILHNFYDKSPEYKFFISSTDPPTWDFKEDEAAKNDTD